MLYSEWLYFLCCIYIWKPLHLVQHIHCSSPLIVKSQCRKVPTCWVIISLCVVLDISVLLWGEINPRETRLQRSTGLWNFIISMLLCPLFHLAAGHACYSVAALPQTFPMWVGYTTRLCCAALRIKGKRYLLIQHRVTWSYPRLKLRERYSSNNARCHPVVHNPHCVRPSSSIQQNDTFTPLCCSHSQEIRARRALSWDAPGHRWVKACH